MKNTLLGLFLLSNFIVFGQNPDANKEAYLTYGTFFLPFNSDNIDRGFNISEANDQWPINHNLAGIITFPSETQNILSSKLNFTVGLNFRLGEQHVVGGMFHYEKQTLAHLINGENWSTSKIKNYSLAARYDYRWVSNDKLKLYSGISGGAGIRNSKTKYSDISSFADEFPEIEEDTFVDNSGEFIYHLHFNAVGLRYGKDWAIIAELGYGNRGYVNVGINHFLFATDKWIK